MNTISQNQIPQDQPKLKPQEGYQEDFLSSPADIVIGGGAAGCGKTFALLMEASRHVKTKGFTGIIFRRTTPQIFNPGGLWDTSLDVLNCVGGESVRTHSQWVFRDKDGNQLSRIKFNHLEYEHNIQDHQGGQYAFIGFDELTHFTKKMFFNLISRNRSNCGIKPYIRATCNPDPDSWVADFITWWIDQNTGFPIPERAGVVRYFIQDGDTVVWGDNVQEVVKKCPHVFNREVLKNSKPEDLIRSVTFIPGSIYENKELLSVNPQYLGGLLSLDEADQQRLLAGNWKIRQDGMALFNYTRINDLFTNFVDKGEKYIVCDAARFGRDLAVLTTWDGYKVIRIEILTKSKTTDITQAIERERERIKIPTSNVLVDQDGVGGGVVDEGGYIGFGGGQTAKEDPDTNIKEFYKNLRTQCYYRFSYLVNDAKVAVSLDDVVVDGVHTTEVKVGTMVYDVKQLIINDLRAIRRKNPDSDNKKQINSKDEIKNILNGRSPDLGDSLIMRVFFDIDGVLVPGIY